MDLISARCPLPERGISPPFRKDLLSSLQDPFLLLFKSIPNGIEELGIRSVFHFRNLETRHMKSDLQDPDLIKGKTDLFEGQTTWDLSSKLIIDPNEKPTELVKMFNVHGLILDNEIVMKSTLG